jgi:hypothetical protein
VGELAISLWTSVFLVTLLDYVSGVCDIGQRVKINLNQVGLAIKDFDLIIDQRNRSYEVRN